MKSLYNLPEFCTVMARFLAQGPGVEMEITRL